jgi:hypothetical protein
VACYFSFSFVARAADASDRRSAAGHVTNEGTNTSGVCIGEEWSLTVRLSMTIWAFAQSVEDLAVE